KPPPTRHPPGHPVADPSPVAAGPDSRAVDTAPPAVDEDALHHHVEPSLPVVNLVVANQDLREARPVRLDLGVATISIDGRSPPEDQTAIAAVENGRAHITQTGVHRN